MSRQCGSIYNGTNGGSIDPSLSIQNRHVSLANIATAFLSERKTSGHRQSSGARKKRLTNSGQPISNIKRQSSYTTTTDEILSQRLSMETMEGGIPTIFTSNGATANTDNKLRSTMVKEFTISFFLLISPTSSHDNRIRPLSAWVCLE